MLVNADPSCSFTAYTVRVRYSCPPGRKMVFDYSSLVGPKNVLPLAEFVDTGREAPMTKLLEVVDLLVNYPRSNYDIRSRGRKTIFPRHISGYRYRRRGTSTTTIPRSILQTGFWITEYQTSTDLLSSCRIPRSTRLKLTLRNSQQGVRCGMFSRDEV